MGPLIGIRCYLSQNASCTISSFGSCRVKTSTIVMQCMQDPFQLPPLASLSLLWSSCPLIIQKNFKTFSLLFIENNSLSFHTDSLLAYPILHSITRIRLTNPTHSWSSRTQQLGTEICQHGSKEPTSCRHLVCLRHQSGGMFCRGSRGPWLIQQSSL